MSSQLGCIIVDDEPLAISILTKYIQKHEDLYLIKSFTRSTEAISYLESNETDVLLLDIHLPTLNGIDFLKKLHKPPPTIFTTAYREYAVDGFELNVIDYLVKPIRYERFSMAVKKIVNDASFRFSQLHTPIENVLNIKMNRKNYRISINDIIYVESSRNNVLIFTSSTQYKCVDTLKVMLQKLPDNFVQVHRSFVINKNYVEHYNKQEVHLGITSLPVGSKYSDVIQQI